MLFSNQSWCFTLLIPLIKVLIKGQHKIGKDNSISDWKIIIKDPQNLYLSFVHNLILLGIGNKTMVAFGLLTELDRIIFFSSYPFHWNQNISVFIPISFSLSTF